MIGGFIDIVRQELKKDIEIFNNISVLLKKYILNDKIVVNI